MTARAMALACSLAGCLIERDPPPCAAPRALTELNTTADENNPMLSNDRLEIMFSRSSQLLFHASRLAPDAAFSTLVQLPLPDGGVATNAFDPWMSADGRKLWFVSGNGDSGGTVYLAYRDESLAGVFDTAHAMIDPDFANLGTILHPSLSDDELELVFSAPNAATMDLMDLWFTRRPSTGVPFPKPGIDLSNIDTSALESGPWLSGDGQLLVFDRTTELQTRYRLATATRSGNDFVDATDVDIPDLADTEDAESPWAAPDGRSIVFARQPNGGNKDLWIYCE